MAASLSSTLVLAAARPAAPAQQQQQRVSARPAAAQRRASRRARAAAAAAAGNGATESSPVIGAPQQQHVIRVGGGAVQLLAGIWKPGVLRVCLLSAAAWGLCLLCRFRPYRRQPALRALACMLAHLAVWSQALCASQKVQRPRRPAPSYSHSIDAFSCPPHCAVCRTVTW